jgi:hypothetical protein
MKVFHIQAKLGSVVGDGATQPNLPEPDIWQFTPNICADIPGGMHGYFPVCAYTTDKAVAKRIEASAYDMVWLIGYWDVDVHETRGRALIVTGIEDIDVADLNAFSHCVTP